MKTQCRHLLPTHLDIYITKKQRTFVWLMEMVFLKIRELHDLRGGERELLEDTARQIERILQNASDSALASRLDVALTERGLITTLAISTARFAAARNKQQGEEELGFALARCMAYAAFYVLAFSGEDALEETLLVGWRRKDGRTPKGPST